MKSFALSLFSSAILLAACQQSGPSAKPQQTSSNARKQSQLPELIPTAGVLGQAVNTASEQMYNLKCVQGYTEFRDGTQSHIRYVKDMSFEDVLNTLSGQVGLGFTYQIVKVGAEANIAKRWGHNSLSETHTFSWVSTPKVETFKLESLGVSPQGFLYAQDAPDDLQNRCGDEFVSEVHRGAMVMANLRIDYLNEQDQFEVGGKLSVDVVGGLVSVEGGLENVNQQVKERSKMSFEVIQKGGDPERLAQILPESLVTCSMSNPEPCLQAMSNVLTYMREDFWQQLDDINKYNPMKYVTQRYDNSGLDILIPSVGYIEISPAIKLIRSSINQSLVQTIQDQQRASTLRSTMAAYIDREHLNQIEALERSALSNARKLTDASEVCAKRPDQRCIDFYENELALEDYDRSILSIGMDEQ